LRRCGLRDRFLDRDVAKASDRLVEQNGSTVTKSMVRRSWS